MNSDSQRSYQFVITFETENISYAFLAYGQTAVDAVESYYSQIDLFCSPSYDEDHCEEFFVSAYRLPLDLPDNLLENLQDMDWEELASETLNFFQKNESVICFTVRVVIENKEMSFFPSMDEPSKAELSRTK